MSIPTKMSGVVLTQHGGPEALSWRDDLVVPTTGPDEILVKVLAAGINNTDINTRIGWYAADSSDDGGWNGSLQFPRVQGGDICGEIVALGQDVTNFSIGQRVTCPLVMARPTAENPVGCIVLGSEIDGGFAQYCKVAAQDVYDVTDSPLSDIEIAAIPCAYGTAENMLRRVGLAQGQEVLITGASGGVGMAAVQLARLRGAKVTGICADAKADAVLNAGAHHTMNRNDPIPKSTFDVVIDVVAGDVWPDLIAALRPAGQYAIAGAIGGPLVAADMRNIYLRDITLHGCTYQPVEVFERLVGLMNSGDLKPLVSRTYPLADIASAQADFIAKTYPGKLVLIPEHEDLP